MMINSRVGAALAPWITKWLIVFHPYLPFLIMGGASFIASILLVWLPETRDWKTSETLDSCHSPELQVANGKLPLLDGDHQLEAV